MVVHKTLLEDSKEIYVLYDDDESIVELPTRFSFCLTNSGRCSPKTVHEYIKELKYFCQFIKTTPDKKFSLDLVFKKAESILIYNYFQHLRSKKIAAKTIRRRDAVLKKFFDWLTTKQAGRVRSPDDHPYADGKYKTPFPKKMVPRFVTHIEVADFILQGFKNESERCIAHFLFDTGARVSELPRLLKEDLPDLSSYRDDADYLSISIKGSKGEGGEIKERHSIISRTLVNRILRLHNNWEMYRSEQKKYPQGQAPMFLNVRGGAITSAAISKKFNRASKELKSKGLLQKSISAHRFRHGCAYSILKSEYGNDLNEKLVVCQANLGHASIRTTEIYTALPAPVLAKLRSPRDADGIQHKRYMEADYIFWKTFKKQSDHTEKRGHYKLKK